MEDNTVEDVRARVKDDHSRLKKLLETALVGACVAQHDRRLEPRVRAALGRVKEEVFAHLDYEERALVELVRGAAVPAPHPLSELVHEHDVERTMLEAVIEDFDAGDRTFQEMADEIAWLASAIESDMAEEERRYLSDEALIDS